MFQIILCSDAIIIQTNDNRHRLKEYEEVLVFLIDFLIIKPGFKLKGITTEVFATDYLMDIKDIDNRYSNLKLSKMPIEQYNIQRNKPEDIISRNQTSEILSSTYEVNYYHESKPCLYKKEVFSTAEYYNSIIGRVNINVAAYVSSSHGIGNTKEAIMKNIGNLRRFLLENLKQSFKDEYIKLLF